MTWYYGSAGDSIAPEAICNLVNLAYVALSL